MAYMHFPISVALYFMERKNWHKKSMNYDSNPDFSSEQSYWSYSGEQKSPASQIFYSIMQKEYRNKFHAYNI